MSACAIDQSLMNHYGEILHFTHMKTFQAQMVLRTSWPQFNVRGELRYSPPPPELHISIASRFKKFNVHYKTPDNET